MLKPKKSIIEKAFASWKDMGERGVHYQKRLRKEWEKRIKRESR